MHSDHTRMSRISIFFLLPGAMGAVVLDVEQACIEYCMVQKHTIGGTSPN